MSKYYIRGIQQVGIGVSNLEESWKWYRKFFGADIRVFDDDAVAEYMLPYTGGEKQSRRAVLAMNLQGGGGFEIWQYKGRTPVAAGFDVQLGDLGINVIKIKTRDIERVYSYYVDNNLQVTEIKQDPSGKKVFCVTDPWNNVFQLREESNWFGKDKKIKTGLVSGVIIGTDDIDNSLAVYRDILGYSKVVYDETGNFEDLQSLKGGKGKFRRILLEHTDERNGCFGKLFGESRIELVQVLDREPRNIYENRFWGDLGFIHVCFDIQGMEELRNACEAKNYPFTVDSMKAQSGKSFDMGDSAGFFSYIEDRHTLIEFVEGHRLPILKAIGWEIDLQKRPPYQPLPDWIVKALSFKRVKD